MIILLTLLTISRGNIWILLGENWCWSLLGLKGLSYAQLTRLQQHGFLTFYVLSYPGRGSILYNGWPSNCSSSLKLVQLISGGLENVYHISRAWLPPERTSYRSKGCHYFRLRPVHLLFAFPDALLQIRDLFSEWLKLVLYPLNVFIWNTKWFRAIFAISCSSSSSCCCCFLLHSHDKKNKRTKGSINWSNKRR